MTDELAPQEPASDAAPETNVTAQPAAPSPAPEPKELSAIEKMQKRIDQLTYRLRETERQQARPESQPQPPEPAKRPTKAEFDYDEDKYQEALLAYTEARAEQIAEKKAQELLEKREREQETKATQQTFQQRQDEFIKSNPDYKEKVLENPELPISEAMAKIIQRREMGPEIAYYLAENLEKSALIAALDPEDTAIELGLIEAQLKAAKKPPPASPKPSAAPPPVPKIEATEPAIEKDPSEMSDKEFAKWRRRQIAQRR